MIKVKIKRIPKARTGYQVQGALVNDVPAMGGADYNAYIGKPKLRESKYITAVPRDEANLEAEGGETVYGDINGDGMPEHQIIKGPRHHSGGVPLNLPDDTFIFSDTRGMKIKDPEILDMFGKAGTNKAYTPAQLAKQYDIQKYRKILEDPESDKLDRETAELMIKKFVVKLGCLALAQEAKKGFPQGIPAVARPCMEAKGITEEQIAPKQEIVALKDQIEAKYKQKENADETMQDEYSNEQAAEAQQINQGQPVAQPQEQMQQPSPEEMMMYGGYRNLRRAQEGMAQVPPEMMEQEQGDGGMMEIVQEVGAALQQGADPEEVVMSLIQNQLPPETIVEIFIELGVPEEEAVGIVQQVMQQMQGGQEQMMAQQPQEQGPPMAMYGMSMGGYDMPFYDEQEYEEELPEADYGMPMGTGMSQNYQGRTKPLIKAGDGWIIKRSDYQTDAEYERAINNAYKEKQKKGSSDAIKVVDASGQSREFTGYKRTAPTDTGSYNWGTTDLAKTAAAQYYLLEQSLKDPNSTVSKKLYEETVNSLKDEKHFRGKTNPNSPSKNWEQRGYTLPNQQQVTDAFLAHQKRNLMFQAKSIDGQIYKDTGRGFAPWEDYTVSGKNYKGVDTLIKEGARVSDPRDPSGNTLIQSKDDLLAAQKYLKDTYGGENVSDIAKGLNVPFDVNGQDRALQQATFHGYALMSNNLKGNVYTDDDAYELRNFLGELQSGTADENSQAGLFPHLKGNTMISPVDDFYSIPSSVYGNTTMEHVAGAGLEEMQFDNPPAIQCQCDDPNKPNYGRLDPNTNTCNPDLCKNPPEENPCPCVVTDEQGNQTDITQPRNADGTCPPCEKEEDLDIPGPPAEWWLQDTIKTTGAFGDLMGVKKYMPWAPAGELQKPRPAFLDPTRELAANAEQANIQTQGMAQFAGPQALSARSASVQGQAAKNAADILSKYNNANVNIANQFELKGTDIANQESMLKQANAQRLYDQNTVANQQFDNAKLAMRNNLRNYYTNAITNKWQTDALNQMYPNYKVSPGVGGRMQFNPTDKKFTGQGSGSSSFDWQKAKDECVKNNPGADSKLIDSCIASKKEAFKTSSNTGPNSKIGMGMYSGMKKGGEANHPGYVYVNSWFPFMD
jgi:hypothetical protein